MILLEEKTPITTIDFFGLRLSIPNGYSWVAADQDGEVWAYENKPIWFHRSWSIPYQGVKSIKIARVDLGSIKGKDTLAPVFISNEQEEM